MCSLFTLRRVIIWFTTSQFFGNHTFHLVITTNRIKQSQTLFSNRWISDYFNILLFAQLCFLINRFGAGTFCRSPRRGTGESNGQYFPKCISSASWRKSHGNGRKMVGKAQVGNLHWFGRVGLSTWKTTSSREKPRRKQIVGRKLCCGSFALELVY